MKTSHCSSSLYIYIMYIGMASVYVMRHERRKKEEGMTLPLLSVYRNSTSRQPHVSPPSAPLPPPHFLSLAKEAIYTHDQRLLQIIPQGIPSVQRSSTGGASSHDQTGNNHACFVHSRTLVLEIFLHCITQ